MPISFIFPVRFFRLSVRQLSVPLIIAVVLLTAYHILKRDSQELLITDSEGTQFQVSSSTVQFLATEEFSSTDHRRLQYDKDWLNRESFSRNSNSYVTESTPHSATTHSVQQHNEQQQKVDANVASTAQMFPSNSENNMRSDDMPSASSVRSNRKYLQYEVQSGNVFKQSFDDTFETEDDPTGLLAGRQQASSMFPRDLAEVEGTKLSSQQFSQSPSLPLKSTSNDVLSEYQKTEIVVSPYNEPDQTTSSVGRTAPHSTRDHCEVSGIESWKRGVVTELRPKLRANCELMRSNDRPEIARVKREIKSWHSSVSEDEWIESLTDCEQVVKDFSNNFYNSPEELDFPLAYIFVVYTNPQQMVRLIKALWRPQNIFCIHPDAKQSEKFIGVFRQLSKCLNNVFLPTKLEKVYYQHHSIMDSQLNCYEDLLRYPQNRWKYVINLCGRELPLKTNREMVRSLKKLKGASAIESKHVQPKGFLTKDRFTWKAAENYTSGKLHYTHTRVPPPPIPIYKSFNFIAASWPFVNFIINNKKAINFRNYLKDVKIPEEEFYASLINLPGVPGGNPPHRVPVPTIDKYIWMNKNTQTRSGLESCEGKMVHFICIVSVGDLDQIHRLGVNRRTPVFFFNKYFMEDDHVVMDCMEERLLHQNMKEHEADCKPR